MNDKPKWTRIVFIIGVVTFLLGTLDPMEGSVVISLGSFLLALASWFMHDRHRIIFIILFVFMAVGVFFLFFLSSFGGFGEGALSWWWSILVSPYPLARLTTVILLIVRAFKKPKSTGTNMV